MADRNPSPEKTATCPSCGLVQPGDRSYCSRCGHHLHSPLQIYRREADGTWSPVAGIDLSKLAPKTTARSRFTAKRAALFGLLLVLPGAALDFWSWRVRVLAARQEAAEITQYLNLPIGRIVPHLDVRNQRSEAGELRVAGETNLPDETALDVRIYSDKILVAVDYPVIVRGGKFRTRDLLERGKPFGGGSYQVRIQATFDKRWQPPAVLQVVGSSGERVQGPLVHRSEGAAMLVFVWDFTLD